jgi:hypothetical protein
MVSVLLAVRTSQLRPPLVRLIPRQRLKEARRAGTISLPLTQYSFLGNSCC